MYCNHVYYFCTWNLAAKSNTNQPNHQHIKGEAVPVFN
jgi:hypothetical protein